MVPDSKKMDMLHVVAGTAKWVRGQHTEDRRSDEILLRHMDYVVVTGSEEHLLSDFEHMKTSLYLTDVVVLRSEGDTINFLGLEITKTRKGFEVKNSTDLVESLLKLYGLRNSKPTVNPGRRSTATELASATPLDGHDYCNCRTASEKLIFMAPWRPDMQFAIQHLSTEVLNPTTESKRAVKQLLRYLKGTHNTCLRLEPHVTVQKGVFELVGRCDSDWAGDSATRQSVTGYPCNAQGVTMCTRSLKPTAISLGSCDAEFYAASACAGELLVWNFTTTFQFVPRWSQIRHVTFHSEEDREDSNAMKFDAWLYNHGS